MKASLYAKKQSKTHFLRGYRIFERNHRIKDTIVAVCLNKNLRCKLSCRKVLLLVSVLLRITHLRENVKTCMLCNT
jgi:hypothetical protein